MACAVIVLNAAAVSRATCGTIPDSAGIETITLGNDHGMPGRSYDTVSFRFSTAAR